jgi:type II secretory pathway component GspD/PulD (secretin)
VPVLGDVPVVGNLFTNRSETTTRFERLILITPRLVRSGRALAAAPAPAAPMPVAPLASPAAMTPAAPPASAAAAATASRPGARVDPTFRHVWPGAPAPCRDASGAPC